MLAESSTWSDWSAGQRIFGVYLLVGFAVVIATLQYLRPRYRHWPGDSVDWAPRGEGSGSIYWLLLAAGTHPITFLIAVALWPIWLVVLLLLHFLR
jgi:hypothetical protein